MKKRFIPLLLLFCMLLNLCTSPAFAAGLKASSTSELLDNSIVLSTQTPVSYVWGERTFVDKDNLSVMPIIENGRTLVPIRFVAESLGGFVTWDGTTNTGTITTSSDIIKITVGAQYMYINNEIIHLDVPAQNIHNRIFVPLRAISTTLEKNIFYYDGFIIVSDYDIKLNEKDTNTQLMLKYLKYAMLVYNTNTTNTSVSMSFMGKPIAEGNNFVIKGKDIPFIAQKDSLCAVTAGMYIENVKCTPAENDEYTISMEVYNTTSTYGIAEFYDAEGNWMFNERIDKFENMIDSLLGTVEAAFTVATDVGWAIGKASQGDWSDFQYRLKTVSAHTHIEKTVPKGTYVYITNNVKNSSYLAMYDMASIVIDSICLTSDWFSSITPSKKEELLKIAKDTLVDELFDSAIDLTVASTHFSDIISVDYSLGTITDYITDVIDKTATLLINNEIDISKILCDAAKAVGKDIIFDTPTVLIKKALGFCGKGLDICFNLNKTSDFASFIIDTKKTLQTDALLLALGITEYHPYKEEYASIIDKYAVAEKANYYNGYADWDAIGVNPELYLSAYKDAKLHYALKDINDDAIPELFISAYSPEYTRYYKRLNSNYTIYDMYTMNGDKAVRLFDIYSMGYRSVYTIRANNIIACDDSGGSKNSGVDFYKLANGSITPQSFYCIKYDGWNGDRYFSGIDYKSANTPITKYEWDNIEAVYPPDNQVIWNNINNLEPLESY